MTNVDPALMKHILDIPERQREADVEHHPQADYLGTRPELLKRGKFCHDRTLGGALPVSMRVCLTGPSGCKMFEEACHCLCPRIYVSMQLFCVYVGRSSCLSFGKCGGEGSPFSGRRSGLI